MSRTLGFRGLALATVACVAVACAASPPPRYFRLTPLAESSAESSARSVVIGPFQLADYLDRPQIVTLDGANELTIADYERWAEPLDANFQSVVATNVGRLLGSDRVLEYPAQAILKPDRRVTGRVSRLDVDAAGLAVLEVQWGVVDATNVVAAPGRRSRYEAQASDATYAARVAAMNATVKQFSVDVAAAVK